MRVLVVDDNPDTVQGTALVLESAGYEVDRALNGEAALELARKRTPAVILLDRDMPGIDGMEVCRRIKEDPDLAHVLVIFASASHAGKDDQMEGLEVGADGYLPRPISNRELRARVDAYARIAALNRELIAANRELDRRTDELEKTNRALEQSRREALGLLEDALEARRQIEAMAHLLQDHDALLNESDNLRGIGGWELDLETKQVRWTPQTRKIHEVNEDGDVPLEEALNYYEPVGRAQLQKAIAEAREQGKPWDLELPLRTAKGKRIWVRAMGQARFKDGRAVKLLGTFMDVTARKRAESERAALNAQLVHAQKMESVGLLAGGIAHEFNNKLQTIIGFAEMSALSCEEGSPLHEELQTIKVAARQAADLTRQLLAYASKQVAQPQTLSLNETVEEILGLLKRTLGENIAVEWDAGHNLWPVHMDPAQVDQIITNLALNARDAMPHGGQLTLSTRNVRVSDEDRLKPGDRPAGEYVRLTIRDTGEGIPAELMEKIFDPFFTTKPQGKGTGLGLSTVFGIVRQNEGFVHVESTPGEGATFSVYVPRDATALTPQQAGAQPGGQAGGHETILVVEDEKAILDLCQMHLGRLGYTVLIAATPSEAIRIAENRRDRIHLLLTDVIMPEMNGRQLFNTLHAMSPRLRVVYMSGYAAGTLGEQGALGKDVLFLPKPFGHQQLARMVRKALDAVPAT